MLRHDFFEKSNWGKKFFWSPSILISTDGAQEMQKSSSRFPVRSCQLDFENQPRSLHGFSPIKTGPGPEPGPLFS